MGVVLLLVLIILIGGGYFYLKNKDKTVIVNLYGTSTDVNTRQVENMLLILKERFGSRMSLDIHLITDRDEEGNFVSFNELNNQEEIALFDIEENKRQIVLQKYYPENFYRYLESRNTDILTVDWQSPAFYAGLKDLEEIDKLVENEGSDLLNQEVDDFKAWRESLSAPPSTIPNLLIDGELYTGTVNMLSLGAAIAKPLLRQGRDFLPKSPYRSLFSGAVLVSSPFAHKVAGITECYNNFHCDDKPDQEGFCVDIGTNKTRCYYAEPAKVDLTVLAPDGYDRDDDVLLWSIKQNIKGAVGNINVVDAASSEGRDLLAQFNLTGAPAYIFARNLEATKYFNLLRARNNFIEIGDFYLLNVQPPAQVLNEPQEEAQGAPEEGVEALETPSEGEVQNESPESGAETEEEEEAGEGEEIE